MTATMTTTPTTNPWADVNFKEVSTQRELIPAQQYTFELLSGAKISDHGVPRIEAAAAITEGEFAGRRIFFSFLTDYKQYPWSLSNFKRLTNAIGIDLELNSSGEPMESPQDYLNRVAGQRFTANVKHRTYTPNTGGDPVTVAELATASFKPAA